MEEIFDFGIFGLGPLESILSSLLSKAGYKVFNYSGKHEYGEDLTSLNIDKFVEEIKTNAYRYKNLQIGIGDLETSVEFTRRINESPENGIFSILTDYLADESETRDETVENATKAKIQKVLGEASKRYYLELWPRLVLCRSDLIELLISSNVGQYMEFRGLEENLIQWDGVLTKVPDSKQAIFSDPHLNLKERLQLSKFIKFVQGYKLEADNQERDNSNAGTFYELLKNKYNLSERTIFALSYNICAEGRVNSISEQEGCEAFLKYVGSIGRYGKMAYLYPMYGGGSELSQAFCRSAAVSGGVFMMGTEIKNIEECTSENGAVEDKSRGGFRVEFEGDIKIKMNRIISNENYGALFTEMKGKTSNKNGKGKTIGKSYVRAVVVFEGQGIQDMNLGLVTVPRIGGVVLEYPIYILQTTSETRNSPNGKSILYGWMECKETNEQSDYETLRKGINEVVGSSVAQTDKKGKAKSKAQDIDTQKRAMRASEQGEAGKDEDSDVDSDLDLDLDSDSDYDLDSEIDQGSEVEDGILCGSKSLGIETQTDESKQSSVILSIFYTSNEYHTPKLTEANIAEMTRGSVILTEIGLGSTIHFGDLAGIATEYMHNLVQE